MILVPTDFSNAARAAAEYAAQLAAATKQSLLLFHAYMLPTPVSDLPYVMVTADALQEENEKMAAKEAERLNNLYQVPVEWTVRIGVPSAEVDVLTEEKNIGWVVMGMKGENGLEKLIGSTTTNTLKRVKVPVIVVPEGCSFRPLQKIAFATDFNPSLPQNVYEKIFELSQHFQSTLDVLHVTKQDELSSEEAAGKIRMSAVLSNVPHEYHEIHENKVVDGILHYLEQQPADLLVMVAQPHPFLEGLFHTSQTRKMAFNTPIPLLVIHQKH